MTYYYKQTDRNTGDLLGFVTYNEVQPNNDNESILLEEITQDEYISIFNNKLLDISFIEESL